jgi:DNA polymerase-3 subunit alpha
VKGVGENAVIAIVDERKRNGRYKSVFDFMERVNLTSCNKRTIESLALCGAFDSFSDIKREQFMAYNAKSELVLDTIIRYGNRYQADMAMSKNSLFGGGDAIEITKPEIPYAPEWSPLERLNKERDLIGMFLSAHPLDEFELEINHICNTTTSDLKDLPPLQGKQLRIGGMVTNTRIGTSKAGNPYGIFSLEDYAGAFEFALFGQNFVEYNKYMFKDLYLYINAIVQEKGADYKFKKPSEPNEPKVLELKIQKIELFREIKDKLIDKLTLSIPLQSVDEELTTILSSIVLENKGNVNFYVNILDDLSPQRVKLFSRQHRLSLNSDIYKKIKRLQQEGILEYQIN